MQPNRDPFDICLMPRPANSPQSRHKRAGLQRRNSVVSATGEFELSILTQAAPAVMDLPPLEPPPQVNVLTTLEDVRSAVNMVAASAQRLMSIYTPNLEPDVYDQPAFLEIIKRFVLARRFAKVRVLLGDGSRILRDSHRFVAMSRRLTSYIDIRVLGDDTPNPSPGYVIADDRAITYRHNATQWEGVADLNNPIIARMHLAEFDEQWISHAPEFILRVARR